MSLLQNQIKQGEKQKTQKLKRQKHELLTKIQSFRVSTNCYLRKEKKNENKEGRNAINQSVYTLKRLNPQKVKSVIQKMFIGNEAFTNNIRLLRGKG